MDCRLKTLRISRGLTQDGLAILLNTSQQTISRIEAGASEVPIDVAVRASEFFQVTVDYILGLSDEKCYDPAINNSLHILKQHEDFFGEFEKLDSKSQEMVARMIHDLLKVQKEFEEKESE